MSKIKILTVLFAGGLSLVLTVPAFSLDQTNGAFTYFISVIGVSPSSATEPSQGTTASTEPVSEPVTEAPASEEDFLLAN